MRTVAAPHTVGLLVCQNRSKRNTEQLTENITQKDVNTGREFREQGFADVHDSGHVVGIVGGHRAFADNGV